MHRQRREGQGRNMARVKSVNGMTDKTFFSDKWYREVVDASGTLVWACDLEGRFSYLNAGWETLLGYRNEEMLGRRFSDFQHPDVVARDYLEFSRHLQGEAVTRYETTYVAKDGQHIHLIFNADPLLDADGAIVGTQGTAFDFNDHKSLQDRVVRINDEFERFFTLIPEMACIASSDGYFKKMNPYWERTLGYTMEELEGASILALIHPDDLPATREEIAKQLQGLSSSGFTNRFRHKDGSYRHVEWQATPASEGNLYAVARDITEQKSLAEKLKLEERRNRIELNLSQFHAGSLQELLDLVLEEMITLSGSEVGYLFRYDEKLLKLSLHAWSKRALEQCGVVDPPAEFQLDGAGVWGDAVRKGAPVVINDFGASCAKRPKLARGHVRLHRFLTVPVYSNGGIVAVVCVGNKREEYTSTDVMQLTLLMDRAWQLVARKKAETDLRSSHDRLRQLSAHMEAVREEERLRISREVHDELGQMLTALKFDISGIKATSPIAEATRRLEQMDNNVSAAIAAVKRIAAELRPKLLDDLGLVSAIEWQANDFSRRTGIACRLQLQASLPPLRPECAIAIFRIFQEALTNVQRHAEADRITVELASQGEEFVLRVADNGKGIRDSEIFAEKSFGIMGMHERCCACRGRLYISGTPGSGTTVSLRIPVSVGTSAGRE